MPNGYEDRLFAKLMTVLCRYHQEQGSWPTILRVPEVFYDDLGVMLAEVDAIEDRLRFVSHAKPFFVAEGPNGETYELNPGRDGYADIDAIHDSENWLTGKSVNRED